MEEENIFEAYFRINKKLIFMISCYNPDYAMQYVRNLNNKTFKKYFKVFKPENPNEFNEIYDKIDQRIIIFITDLPTPELYSFNFIKEVFHIHLAIPQWNADAKKYNEYLSDIQKVSIQKFINVKDNKNIYNDNIEERIFQVMIKLVDDKVNNNDDNNNKFPRMSHTGGKLFLYGSRELVE
jgi:hypothetical protein